MWLIGPIHRRRFEEPLGDKAAILRGIAPDKRAHGAEILDGLVRPADERHSTMRRRASSWLIVWPESDCRIPSSIFARK